MSEKPTLRLVLHADIHPQARLISVVAAIEQAVDAMRIRGVHVHEISLDRHGLGDAVIDALRDAPALRISVTPISSR